MANMRNSKHQILNLFNLGSSEETKKKVKRVAFLQDLEQVTSKRTILNPATGRRTTAEVPSASLTPSGHYVADLDHCLGECAPCREVFEADGQPDRITLVPRGEGGGTCKGCGRVICNDHGSFDDQGRFWCEDCGFDEKLSQAQQTIIGMIFGKWTRRQEEKQGNG